MSSKPYWGHLNTCTEMPSWNISPSTDTPSIQYMNTECHYNLIALGNENELLHMCIDIQHM